MSKKLEYCCDIMNSYVKKFEEIDAIEYDSYVRSYSLPLYKEKKYIGMRHRIWFCPWCGKELPKDLYDEIEEILLKEHGITVRDFNNGAKVPEEFKTDEWWKKRNL